MGGERPEGCRQLHSEEEKQQGAETVIRFLLANKQELLKKRELRIDVPQSVRSSHYWTFQVTNRLVEEGLYVKINSIIDGSKALVQLVR